MKQVEVSNFYRVPPTSNNLKVKVNTGLVFDRQDDAIKYYINSSESLYLFSYEFECVGRRKFLLDTIDNFYEMYIQLKSRHFYELILPFSPCNLYLDLEYYTKFNANLDGNEILDRLVCDLEHYMKTELNYKIEDVVQLTSHTCDKFSVHLIIHLRNSYFKSNEDCKHLMYNFMDYASSLNKSYLVNNEESQTTFFDMSVYSKNRQFRLYLSCKYGKSAILDIPCTSPSLKVFKSTLITFCPFNEKTEILIIPSKHKATSTKVRKHIKYNEFNSTAGSGSAIFDDYMRSQVKGHVNKIMKKQGKIVLGIVGDRYCERINRQHKSNGIYYVVDTKLGIYYQMCHDIECAGFTGVYHDLPDDIFYEIMEVDMEYIQGQVKRH
eukprot:NODE_87_length_21935_cov_0.397142.p5 type:complete len:380 gc:universal NODE_87_length_21935_cov_0.397142:13419-12280(-)